MIRRQRLEVRPSYRQKMCERLVALPRGPILHVRTSYDAAVAGNSPVHYMRWRMRCRNVSSVSSTIITARDFPGRNSITPTSNVSPTCTTAVRSAGKSGRWIRGAARKACSPAPSITTMPRRGTVAGPKGERVPGTRTPARQAGIASGRPRRWIQRKWSQNDYRQHKILCPPHFLHARRGAMPTECSRVSPADVDRVS